MMDNTPLMANNSTAPIWSSTYTIQGLALMAKLHAKTKLEITRVLSGAGYVNPETLVIQSGVTEPRKGFSIGEVSVRQDGLARLPVQLTNAGVTVGYSLWQVGVYVADPDEGEILYCIMQSSAPDQIPTEAQMPGFMVNFGISLVFANAEHVQVTIDPEGLVTNDTLELRLKPLEPYYTLAIIEHGLCCYPLVLLGTLRHGLGLGGLGDGSIGGTDTTQRAAQVVYHSSHSLTIQTVKAIVELGTEKPQLHRQNSREYFITWPDNPLDSVYVRLI